MHPCERQFFFFLLPLFPVLVVLYCGFLVQERVRSALTPIIIRVVLNEKRLLSFRLGKIWVKSG